jgi:hypothetical protein
MRYEVQCSFQHGMLGSPPELAGACIALCMWQITASVTLPSTGAKHRHAMQRLCDILQAGNVGLAGCCPHGAICWWQGTNWTDGLVSSDPAMHSLYRMHVQEPSVGRAWCRVRKHLARPAAAVELGEGAASYSSSALPPTCRWLHLPTFQAYYQFAGLLLVVLPVIFGVLGYVNKRPGQVCGQPAVTCAQWAAGSSSLCCGRQQPVMGGATATAETAATLLAAQQHQKACAS